ncbi:MAG: prephenate dehydratase [Patescibacteria group bacterium]
MNRDKKYTKIAFQGEHGAYSEIAARKYFGERSRTMPCASFDEVFKAVARARASAGVVPLENSVAGTIHRSYDLLARHALIIDGEISLHISHNLLGMPSKVKGLRRLRQVKRVYSHPQALDQCEEFLARHPWMEVISYRDTAGAAHHIATSRRQDEAAIASSEAARLYGLRIIAEHLESNQENYTRFGVVAEPLRRAHERLKGNKVSLLLTLPHIAGSLSRFLVQCAGRGMNLTKVESRPLLGKPWEYLFYVDFEHAFSPEALQRALTALKVEASTFTILGVYDRGATYEL